MNAILTADISTDAVVYSAAAVACILFVILFLRPSGKWAMKALAGVAAGAILGLVVVWLAVDVVQLVNIPIKTGMKFWFVAICAALGLAVVNFWKSPRWRKWIAAVSIPVFVLAGGIGINAGFGLNKTLASVLGISTGDSVVLPDKDKHKKTDESVPLWQSWKAPAGMPATGQQGIQEIPNTKSGFNARPAGIYLPPAAKTANPPTLPIVVMLMGQPGNPEPQFIGAVLDKYAAEHDGLAPIVVVADQVGPDQNDTLCLDSKAFGNVESYIMDDVVGFAKEKLGVMQNPKFWTIAGYSNGGQCAISLGAKHPDVFGNILDISGEEYPGAENPGENLAKVFNGDQAAYDAQMPINIMAKRQYSDVTAIFTAGSDDSVYVAAAKKVSAAAKAAGMDVSYFEVPNGGHGIAALNGGLDKGFEILYPRLGLSH